jgi:hypothetical protein
MFITYAQDERKYGDNKRTAVREVLEAKGGSGT